MKERKIPMRTCIISREKHPKQELIRIVRTPEGELKVDQTGKLNGRGVYLKLNKETIEKAKKTNKIEKELSVDNNNEIYEELLKLI